MSNNSQSPSMAVQKSYQVPEQLDDTDKALNLLHQCISELESRLKSVLRVPEDGKEGGVAPNTVVVPLADILRSQRKSLDVAINDLQSILMRLEI